MRIRQILILILLLCLMISCAAKSRTQVAKVYKETGLVKPGSYHLQFFPNGQGTLAEYLLKEKAQNQELKEFDISVLEKLFRTAYPQLYLPVQRGIPLCNLETNFKFCKGIELLADFETYKDDTIVLHSHVFYHIKLRLYGDQSNFFRAAKAQRDQGEFALPRHYYVGSLVEDIQKSLPILQEIAMEYGKYIKDDNQEIEIELTLEEAREKSAAKKADQSIKDTATLSGSVIFSSLPLIPSYLGLTVSALNSGGRTFWEVLKEKKSFDLSQRALELNQVDFSYTESFTRNFSRTFRNLIEPPSDILIRKIIIRLCEKEHKNIASAGQNKD
ncbi:MAG TPA: hypothetical protein VMT12_08525 [Syntrophales bacterium]|nr:hypothetical protein [Syntrophales bacterium]